MPATHDKSYFHFTKKERKGILFLTGIALTSVIVSISHQYILRGRPAPTHTYSAEMAKLEAQSPDTTSIRNRYIKEFRSYTSYSKSKYIDPKGELFHFDPNTISDKEWRRLGLRDKTIGMIKNYLAKGGQFREATDIKKIWGLNEKLADRIIPFARITIPESRIRSTFSKTERQTNYTTKKYQFLNINEGDTNALTKLPGIGPKLSQRIVKYRDRLGGFHSVDQVAETFGLPDSTFQKIRSWLQVEKGNVKTININTATLDELRAHPYIRYHLANAIVQYRQQHKSYSSVNEIRNIMLVDDTTYRKVAPYLAVE